VTADTIELDKMKAGDVCAEGISLRNTSTGDVIPVLSVDNLLEETILNIDRISGYTFVDTIDADKLFAHNICADTLAMINEEGFVTHVAYINPDGSVIIGADTLSAGKVLAFDICSEGVSLVRSNGDATPVLYEGDLGETVLDIQAIEGPFETTNMYADTVDVTKLIADDVCTDLVSVRNIAGEPIGVLGDLGFGITLAVANVTADHLDVGKIVADDICTDDFTIFKPNGDILLDVNPGANTSNQYGFVFNHNVMVNGILMATQKQFVIDHPLDPEHKILRHYSIESDQLVNMYTGTVVLDAQGEAQVQMPDWFEALNTDFSYQLTCIGGYAQVYIAQEITDNRFKIAGGAAGMKISWQVNGVRHDRQALEQQMPLEDYKNLPATEASLSEIH